MTTRDHILVWLIAGEPSGDLIGARLMAALKDYAKRPVKVAGVGGEAMIAAGLDSRFPISDIAVMGIVEIIPRLPLLRRRIAETVSDILADKPDVVVSIDSPGFCSRVWKRLSDSGIPLVHYVAPSVWAWNPGRAARYAARLDHMIALLPFEPAWFRREGLDCTFAGHPVLESAAGSGDGIRFRKRHGIRPDTTVICVLPGSRRGEISRMLPVFREAAHSCHRPEGETVYVFPTVEHLSGFLSGKLGVWPGRSLVVESVSDKFDAMAASAAAMATSGTVSLELAMAGVPHVIAYRISRVTAGIVGLMGGKTIRFVNLINILLDREVVPEFIQGNCHGPAIASALQKLMHGERDRHDQLKAVGAALDMLRPAGLAPSRAAAAVVLACAQGGRADLLDKEEME